MHKTTTKGTCSTIKKIWLYFWSKKSSILVSTFTGKKKEIGHLKKLQNLAFRIPLHQNRQLAIYSLTCGNHPPETCLQDYRSILLSSRQIRVRSINYTITILSSVFYCSITEITINFNIASSFFLWNIVYTLTQLWKCILCFLSDKNTRNLTQQEVVRISNKN